MNDAGGGMTREEWLELALLHLHESLTAEIERRQDPGGIQLGIPRLGGLPLSVLHEWERDIRHAVEATEDWVAAAEKGELEHWLQSRDYAVGLEERQAMARIEQLLRAETVARLRLYRACPDD
jgi:hypothetical protein